MPLPCSAGRGRVRLKDLVRTRSRKAYGGFETSSVVLSERKMSRMGATT